MPTPLTLAIGGTFVAVALAAGSATSLILRRQVPARRRLRLLAGEPRAAAAAPGAATLADQPDWLEKHAARFVPKSPKAMDKVRRRLARAGFHRPSAAIAFSFTELGLPLLAGGVPLGVLGWPQSAVFALAGAVIGYLLPGVVLARLVEKRKTAISNGLPDALDLLSVCLEAGYGLDHALAKASEELVLAHPALAEELKLLTSETRAGKPRVEAFRNIEARTKNEDVRGLVGMLVQTERFGTSIGQALRTLSDTLRIRRRQRAEERAARVGVKLVFPLVMCLFPALYVVILGPAIVQILGIFFRGR